jgi:hypothetical protein
VCVAATASLPFTSAAFAPFFGAHIVNKFAIVVYSEVGPLSVASLGCERRALLVAHESHLNTTRGAGAGEK